MHNQKSSSLPPLRVLAVEARERCISEKPRALEYASTLLVLYLSHQICSLAKPLREQFLHFCNLDFPDNTLSTQL